MKERTWLGILLSFAAPCRGKMAASVVLAILSVAGGFVPYLGVYQIIRLFLDRQADWEGILFWCGVCLVGYVVKVAGYALSTMLAHVSAYTILEGLRLQAADRLMGAPLGEVESRPIGAMKSTIVDRIEDIEPPLAHMIPELSSNLLLPLAVVIAMFAIDWRIGLVVWVGFLLLFLLTKYVSLGSVWAGASFPFATWYFYPDPVIVLLAFLLGALILWKHRSNIVRLIHGNENKFSVHRKKN